MPAKTSKKRRGAGGNTAVRVSRAQQRQETRRPVATRPYYGSGLSARWHRFIQSNPWVARVIGPESALWVTLLLAIPVLAVGLDLTVGLRLDQLAYVDVDYWWHLATGNWVLDNHRVPTTDPFSWTYGGREWIAHEWLAEAMLALSVRAGGYAGAIILTIVFVVLGFWRLLAAGRYYGMSRRLAVGLMLLSGPAFLRSGAMVVRPQVWTWALLAILLAELAAYDTGRRKQLWIIPVLFAIWINMNLTALIGIGCLGAFVLDRLIRRPVDRHVVTVGVLSGLALLANPHHIKLFFLIFKYLNPDSVRRQYVFEWMPPRTSDNSHIPFWIALVTVIPAAWYLLRRRPHFWPAAPLLVLAYQSYQSIRYIPIFLMLAIVFVGWLIWQRAQSRGIVPAPATSPLIPLRPWVLAPPLAAAALAIVLALQTEPTQFRRNPIAWGHPVGAADFYLENYPNTRIFNTYDFGGYLIYRFAGTDNKVYIDGREEMYGEDRVRRYFYYIYGRDGWQDYFDEQGIEVVIIRRIDGLSAKIAEDPGWKLAYRDNAHLIFIRNTEAPQSGT